MRDSARRHPTMGPLDPHGIERWLEWPAWAKDAVVTDVAIHFDWRDRLLVLLGRPVIVTTKALTEHVAGRTEGRSRVSVLPIPWPWRRSRLGVVAAYLSETADVERSAG